MAMDMPSGYEPPQSYNHQQSGGGGGSTAGVAQLFARLSQEIEENKPKNCIHFTVDFLCKHYPEHLHGFASIWQMDPDLEGERHEVVNFFKAHKISTAVAAHFANAGYDTLDTLTTLSPDGLVDIEAFNNVKWLPGHKVRLQQIFGEISARVRAYREQTQSRRSPAASPSSYESAARYQSPAGHQRSPQLALPAYSPASHVSPSYQPAVAQSPLGYGVKEASTYPSAAAHNFPFHAGAATTPGQFGAPSGMSGSGLAGGAPAGFGGMGGPGVPYPAFNASPQQHQQQGLHHPNLYLAA